VPSAEYCASTERPSLFPRQFGDEYVGDDARGYCCRSRYIANIDSSAPNPFSGQRQTHPSSHPVWHLTTPNPASTSHHPGTPNNSQSPTPSPPLPSLQQFSIPRPSLLRHHHHGHQQPHTNRVIYPLLAPSALASLPTSFITPLGHPSPSPQRPR
jgi:hypothetical protein